jgi:hypothetical protein
MTDGLSEARRRERACEALSKALEDTQEALEELNDAVYGLPRWVHEDIQRALQRYGITVTETSKR